MTDTNNYETRKTLISRLTFSFEAELLDDDCKKIYDEKFLLRMGKEAGRLLRSFEKTVGLMILIDTVMLLILSGKSLKIEVFGSKISDFPGLVEIGILFSSLAYLSSTKDSIDYRTYIEIIKCLLMDKNEKNDPNFYMSSLFSFDYSSEVIKIRPSVLKSGIFQKLSSSILLIMTIILPVSLYLFHFFTVWLVIDHIFDVAVFGVLATKLIAVALCLINLTGFFLYLTVHEYPFKFRASLPKNNS